MTDLAVLVALFGRGGGGGGQMFFFGGGGDGQE